MIEPPRASAFQPYNEQQHRALIGEAARALCDGGTHLLCEGGCGGYHRGWMLLQDLGLISGLFSERAYIVEAIRARARERALRSVHIAGCADFGLLSVLHEALGADIGALRVHISDRCDTPLSLCQRYAARFGLSIDCERRDLLVDPERGPFDLVLMHSLLSFCEPAERGALLGALASALDRDGLLLVYQSIRPGSAPRALAYGDSETDDMVRQAIESQHASPDRAPWPPLELERHVREFCRAKTTTSVHSAKAVLADAAARGLALRHSRLLFDSAASTHRAATPKSHHVKYEFGFGRAEA